MISSRGSLAIADFAVVRKTEQQFAGRSCASQKSEVTTANELGS
jgi:hypothetical protein